jgi:hypothetical protein
MDFGDLRANPAKLEPTEAYHGNTVIGPEAEVTIELKVPPLTLRPRTTSDPSKKPTLWVTVEESNGKVRYLTVQFSEDAVRGFVEDL